MNNQDIYKQTFRMIVFTVLSILLARVTHNYILPLYIVAGLVCVLTNRLGWALVFYVLFPFFAILNPGVLPKAGSITGYSLRIGPLLMGLTLAFVAASRQGRHRLPFIMMVPFMMAAVVSSVDGWAPMVSMLKIVNFAVFLLGIWFGTQNLQQRPKDLFVLRSFFLALAFLLIAGSVLLWPFPSISFATSLRLAMRDGGAELAEEVFRHVQAEGMQTLFCGITNHSQALGPLAAAAFAFTACDMLFVERRFRLPHVVVLFLALPVLYLTRSRLALLTLVSAMAIIVFYTSRRMQMRANVRARLEQGVLLFMVAALFLAVVSQLTSGSMSQWVRKTDDTSRDRRSLGEALTSSRLGLIGESLEDFRRKPMIGMGFQVAEYTRRQTRGRAFVVSASIEKGVLPVMVLGETGILGFALFGLFVASFCYTCSLRRYYVTVTLFSVFLVANMGEAMFFSPGGCGGFLWMLCVVGGFSLDTMQIYRRDVEAAWRQMAFQRQIMASRGMRGTYT
jgi:O-antigen ligase